MKKTLPRASAANNKRNRIAEQCFHEIITAYTTDWRRLWPALFYYRNRAAPQAGLPCLFRYLPPQGGDVAAQFPDDFRQACQLVFHAHQQKPAQDHGETEILNKAEYFGHVHLQPHFP